MNGKVPDCGSLKLQQSRNTISGVSLIPINLDDFYTNQLYDLSEIVINYVNIMEAILQIPNDATPRPDGVSLLFLNKGGTFIIGALSDISKVSLNHSYIPQTLNDI